ncbi:MAG TPA: Smr/MutS family protein, partial [Stellaceae bacterium]|nr:Smr/MutS family protein [Stellaceae bacterium]
PPNLTPLRAPLATLDHGAAPGVDKRTLERFRKGEMGVDASLDLHGMTQDAAHAALVRFVQRAAASGHRALLIVTGKGGREGTGVLRAQVPRWLNEADSRPLLLAIHRARPQHGGDGALYVLLKRKR